jgi:AcrR family transcriptional regulator
MARPEDPTARERLLDAATELFYERGVAAVGVAEVVAAAGTGKQALYRHFPGGKDELVLAYLEAFATRIDAGLDRAVGDLPPDEALVAVARRVSRLVSARGYRGCPFRNYLRETREHTSAPGRYALAQVRGFRRRIERLSADLDGADPSTRAERIWVLLEGVYAAAPYPERARIAASAVTYVEELVA